MRRSRSDEALPVVHAPEWKLIDAMTEGVLYQNALGQITAVNPAALRITGRTETEVLGQTFGQLQTDAVREDGRPFPVPEQPSVVSLQTGRPQHDVIMGVRRPDGTQAWISVNAQPLVAGPGEKPYAVVTTLHDVTERKRIQDALALRDQELRSLAHSSPGLMGTFYQRPDGSVCMPYTSPRIWDLFGVRSEDVAEDATPLLQRTHPEDAARVSETIAESARTMTPWRLEYRVVHPTRGEIWLEGCTNPEPHPSGGIVWYGFVHDVTARKRTQHELALTRFALDHVREAAYLMDEQGRFVYVNDESCQALGYSRDELVGMGVPDIDPNFTQTQWENRRKQGLRSTSLQTYHRRKDGGTFPVEIYSNYFEYDGRRYVLSLARDISERMRAEEALRESEQRFRQVTENIDEVFWLTNVANSELMYVSPAYSTIWGRSCESLYAAPRSWLDAIHADDRERIRAALSEHAADGRYDVEYRVVRPDGSLRWGLKRYKRPSLKRALFT